MRKSKKKDTHCKFLGYNSVTAYMETWGITDTKANRETARSTLRKLAKEKRAYIKQISRREKNI